VDSCFVATDVNLGIISHVGIYQMFLLYQFHEPVYIMWHSEQMVK